ncbi:tRNA 2-thiouridine(34) synthase MnmA [Candidatus Peregrinibacteria bacterium]|nr:tRNA 2-thiouridine(34) synthase MnmA [Candidatus Peregrinibacteria bacterium]
MKEKVIVAMSGGIDSCVAAALLAKQGYECVGIHLRFWMDPVSNGVDGKTLPQNKCCTIDSLEDARWACQKLGIPFYVMDVAKPFKQKVVDYFLDEYACGKTPNPCVECNRSIKFGKLLKRAAELGADYVATGHYARISKDKTGGFALSAARDKVKDQSYFLYHLGQKQLAKVLFPLGNLLKSQVYELAGEFGLKRIVERKESQGLCFFAENTPKYFLQRHLPAGLFKNGPIVTVSGKEIGIHKGLPLYTVGQRQGLGIGGVAGEKEGEGWYVVSMDGKANKLVVGRKNDILFKSLVCSKLSFVDGAAPKDAMNVRVRIRHRGRLVPAKLVVKNGKAFVESKSGFTAASKGQSAVFYQRQKVLGGGIMKSAL